MSCNIREYEKMSLTACVGPEGDRTQIQFTIGDKYAVLGERELLDLIRVICARIMGKKGYTATGGERKNIGYKYVKDEK